MNFLSVDYYNATRMNQKNNISKPGISVFGRVIHKLDGQIVFVKTNQIHAELLSYLAQSLNTNINKAIDDLFTDDEVTPGGTQDGKDGISFYDGTAEQWRTFQTSVEPPAETNGRRWKGLLTSTQSHSVQQVAIGHSFQAGSKVFETIFATQTFDALEIAIGKSYEVEWEIFIKS